MYWMMLYRAMNLKTQNDVMRAARPSLWNEQDKSLLKSENKVQGTAKVLCRVTSELD